MAGESRWVKVNCLNVLLHGCLNRTMDDNGCGEVLDGAPVESLTRDLEVSDLVEIGSPGQKKLTKKVPSTRVKLVTNL